MARIQLKRASLTFHVRTQAARMSFKEYLVQGLFMRFVPPTMQIHALRDVTLDIRPGERVGIIGHNGAGKSTLLKLLAGIYEPTSGKRKVEGRVSSLFDLMLGFEPEATGWQNIRYRGYLQGETPWSIGAKLEEIGAFTELGKFLDTPVRYYSAGMLVRLAFAISTAIEPEILLIDEALGAGDMAFQDKARKRMREMMDRAKLIVTVSHDLGAMPKFCTRGLWMDKGRLRMSGPMTDVIEAYTDSVRSPVREEQREAVAA